MKLGTLKLLGPLELHYPRHPQSNDTTATNRDGGGGAERFMFMVWRSSGRAPGLQASKFLGAGEEAHHGTAHCGRGLARGGSGEGGWTSARQPLHESQATSRCVCRDHIGSGFQQASRYLGGRRPRRGTPGIVDFISEEARESTCGGSGAKLKSWVICLQDPR